jgi:hypothetical protein
VITGKNKCDHGIYGMALLSPRRVRHGDFESSKGWQINHLIPKTQRGSLPNQAKAFIDANECNVIFAHSMGNLIMGEVYKNYGNDYKWYDMAGPMRGSYQTAAVLGICEQEHNWSDYLNPLNWGAASVQAVASMMGYCDDDFAALEYLVPHPTKQWPAQAYGCLTPGAGPYCVASNAPGGATHPGFVGQIDQSTFGTHYFDSTTQIETCTESCGDVVDWGSCGWRGCNTNFFCNLSCAWSTVTSSVCEERATCRDDGELLNNLNGYINSPGWNAGRSFSNPNGVDVTDGVLGTICGDGDGNGIGGALDHEKYGLMLFHTYVEFGQHSDGMVPASSCMIGQNYGTNSNNANYHTPLNHADLTGRNGDGAHGHQKTNAWMVNMINTPACVPADHYYENNGSCAGWKDYYCPWHAWVQQECPCTCA